MKSIKSKLFGLSFLAITGAQAVQADVITNYTVQATFEEPAYRGGSQNTVFNGTFTYNATKSQITNLTGTLSEAMTACLRCSPVIPQTLLTLSYDPVASKSDGNGGIIASAFLLNNTTMFANGDINTAAGTIKDPSEANAYVTIDVSASQLSGADMNLAASSLGNLFYGDCTPGGMMGELCMTGVIGGGTMAGYPLSEKVMMAASPVPLPAAVWLFLAGTFQLLFFGKQRKSL